MVQMGGIDIHHKVDTSVDKLALGEDLSLTSCSQIRPGGNLRRVVQGGPSLEKESHMYREEIWESSAKGSTSSFHSSDHIGLAFLLRLR